MCSKHRVFRLSCQAMHRDGHVLTRNTFHWQYTEIKDWFLTVGLQARFKFIRFIIVFKAGINVHFCSLRLLCTQGTQSDASKKKYRLVICKCSRFSSFKVNLRRIRPTQKLHFMDYLKSYTVRFLQLNREFCGTTFLMKVISVLCSSC